MELINKMKYNQFNNEPLAKMVKQLYDSQGKQAGLVYHLWDHSNQVRKAGSAIGRKENISEKELFLLDTASIVHDIGNILSRQGHEEAGIEFAKINLPYFGFANNEIEIVNGIIKATKFPQQPQNHLEQIMVDADLSLMGYKNWPEQIDKYRQELKITDMFKWYESQITFLIKHEWFTQGAKELYDVQKNKNLDWVKNAEKKYFCKTYNQ